MCVARGVAPALLDAVVPSLEALNDISRKTVETLAQAEKDSRREQRAAAEARTAAADAELAAKEAG